MKSTPITPRLLRTREAAQYLSMSPWQVRNLAHEGKLPFVAEEGSCVWRFDRDDLDCFITDNKTSLV
jgi:excisionase family DNA binding protein